MNDKYLSISEVNNYIKNKFDSDEVLMSIYLKGEISNFKRQSSGHCYFTLKDEEDKLNSDIKKLKDPEYVARYAREKYMYSKDGELIIRLPDDDTDK